MSFWERLLAWWNGPREKAAKERERYIRHLEAENAELKEWLKSLNGSMVAGLGMPIVNSSTGTERRPIPSVVRCNVPSLRRSQFEAQAERKKEPLPNKE